MGHNNKSSERNGQKDLSELQNNNKNIVSSQASTSTKLQVRPQLGDVIILDCLLIAGRLCQPIRSIRNLVNLSQDGSRGEGKSWINLEEIGLEPT